MHSSLNVKPGLTSIGKLTTLLPRMIKRILMIALLLAVSGGTGRAAVLCARLICPQQNLTCCCQVIPEQEEPMLRVPISCNRPSRDPQSPALMDALAECCSVSSSTQKQASNRPTRISVDIRRGEHQNPIPTSSLILPDSPLRQISPLNSALFYADRPDVYYLPTVLRI